MHARRKAARGLRVSYTEFGRERKREETKPPKKRKRGTEAQESEKRDSEDQKRKKAKKRKRGAQKQTEPRSEVTASAKKGMPERRARKKHRPRAQIRRTKGSTMETIKKMLGDLHSPPRCTH